MSMEHYDLPEDLNTLDRDNLRIDITQTPMQAEQGYVSAENVDFSTLKKAYSNVIITGMGGSSIAGRILKCYLSEEPLRIYINRDYSLPAWTDKNTLIIVSSYSGNTEETLSAFKEARRKQCDIVIVTSGGKLEEYANVSRIPMVTLPPGHAPRSEMAVEFFAILRVLEKLNLIKSKANEVLRLKDDLRSQIQTLEKNAIVLSEKFTQKVPLIYTSKRFEPIGYRWKSQFNENAKILAFNNVFPEMNHNEIEGLGHLQAGFHAVILKFEEDHRRTQKRMKLTKDIFLKRGVTDTEIGIRGPSLLSKIFSAIILGDFTSYYLAMRFKINPNKYLFIEDFKKEMGPFIS